MLAPSLPPGERKKKKKSRDQPQSKTVGHKKGSIMDQINPNGTRLEHLTELQQTAALHELAAGACKL